MTPQPRPNRAKPTQRVVLLIEEAQNLSVDALEQIRLLTNLETDTQKLLQIILLGQPELRDLLARPQLRQLAQRVTARYHLTPLAFAETVAYARHRLAVAGAMRPLFSALALRLLHWRAGGVPRLINVIADRALIAAYVNDQPRVGWRLLSDAANEVLHGSGQHGRLPQVALWLLLVAALTALVGVAIGYWP